jgi:hypothetical protein
MFRRSTVSEFANAHGTMSIGAIPYHPVIGHSPANYFAAIRTGRRSWNR